MTKFEMIPAGGRVVPQEIRTRCGYTLNTGSLQWIAHSAHRSFYMNFESLISITTPPFFEALQLTLCWYAENMSISRACGLFYEFKRLIRHVATVLGHEVGLIRAVDILNYKASLTRESLPALASVRTGLAKWHALGYEGVADDAVKLLRSLRISGGEKGKAVRSRDPHIGPYTNLEFESLIDGLNEGYENGVLRRDEYLLIWFFMLFGARPAQFALMKVCDLVRGKMRDGSHEYVIKIPAVKTRAASARATFLNRPLKGPLAAILEKHIAEVQTALDGRLADVSKAPLFFRLEGAAERQEGFQFHCTAPEIGRRVLKAVELLEVRSERTGELLHGSPIRFRRTLGTRMAAEGHGELVIAQALGHSDTQHVMVYVQTTPEVTERIDRAVAMQLAPLANAFKGTIVADESEAVRGSDPASRIVDGRFDETFKPMGNCGRNAICEFAAPLACYTCKSFQPWLKGPHEKVLNFLIEERNRLLASSDAQIATINDRTILAVAEVVQLCARMEADHG